MQLPAPLLRRNPKAHKNKFGHVLILAGSRAMLGAAALTGLSAMRAGAGLVTIAIPESLNLTLQKKISPVAMTLPLKETKSQSLDLSAYNQIKKNLSRFQAIAIGPGLSGHSSTKKLILKIIGSVQQPIVIDADALNALPGHLEILKKTKTAKILTPHAGEMARLTGIHINKPTTEENRQKAAQGFAKRYNCTLVLKGHRSVVASSKGRIYLNPTGNAGMATAGSGDVLTGILAALLGQGIEEFEAACFGVFLHGKAGDLAAKSVPKASLIATDIIDFIPHAFRDILKTKTAKSKISA